MPKQSKPLKNAIQLDKAGNVFSLGSDAKGHCTVVFGLSSIDEDRPRRTIKLSVNEDDFKVLACFDATHEDLQDIIKDEETAAINLKVDMKTTKVIGGTLEDLAQDVECDLIVKVVSWNMNGQKGVSLRCLAIKIAEDDYTF
jgi:hypothetical protein